SRRLATSAAGCANSGILSLRIIFAIEMGRCSSAEGFCSREDTIVILFQTIPFYLNA
ncbi:hypothetical protein NDU88_000977, partial [Pleurodeles waltl]